MKTILLADDNHTVREFCRRELEEEGYRVVLARDGGEAIGVLRRELPDLVVLDICMPRTDGLEAVQRIKEIEPQVPVIFFTSYDEDCLKDRRGQLATACIEKCEDLTELKRVVVRALSSRDEAESLHVGLPPKVPL
jgi:CheY-like chemotaxis protein